ncbi:minor tail protein [Nocardia phage P3.1]|nr:minor tail protein [Nocardia phage P3.1]
MSMPMNLLFGDQTGGESQKVRNLRTIDSGKYNREFTQNIAGLNAATDYMAQYLIVMQKGIDDANKNIIQKIQDFIADLIIIFTGGSDTGFEFGDLGYIIQALGALFGFQGLDGPVNLLEAAAHFLGNFLQPLGLLGDIVNGFIKAVFEFFAGLLSNVPIVGDTLSEIVTNMAAGINDTTDTANNAETTANTANTNASNALSQASTANSNASAAQTAASNAASVAAAAQDTADVAVELAQNDRDGFAVSTAGLNLGINEEPLGILLTVPAGRTRTITRVIYTCHSNTGTITIQLIRRQLNGAETVVLTTNVSSGALVHPDSSIDYGVTDLDQYHCNITAISGVVTGLSCWIESIIQEV